MTSLKFYLFQLAALTISGYFLRFRGKVRASRYFIFAALGMALGMICNELLFLLLTRSGWTPLDEMIAFLMDRAGIFLVPLIFSQPIAVFAGIACGIMYARASRKRETDNPI